MFILPYKAGSASAKVLGSELGAKRIKLEGSKFKGSPKKTVINWGSSSVSEEVAKCNIINHPDAVAIASNKLKFFNALDAYNDEVYEGEEGRVVRTPQHTTIMRTAQSWQRNGNIVVERHKLTGNSGVGINLVETDGEITDAPLYVKYIPKKQEYRVHVANGIVVDLQRKARRHDVADEDINWRIRNHDNGFIFQRNDLIVPNDVSIQAINACKAVGLDFGAVDVVYNDRQGRAFVLEINTAPGLTGSTLEGYVERFKDWDAVFQVPMPDNIPAPVFDMEAMSRLLEAADSVPVRATAVRGGADVDFF